MKKSKRIKNVIAMLVFSLFFGCVPVRADVIYDPMMDVVSTLLIVLVVGGAVALVVIATICLLAYIKKSKKKSKQTEHEEKSKIKLI